MEDIEKQAALILNKEMEDELNDAYCTLLLNLKNTPKKYEESVESMKYFYLFFLLLHCIYFKIFYIFLRYFL